jgi:MoxR-like ATPase
MALIEGHDFVTPEIIQQVAVDVIAHRLVLEPEARFAGLSARQVVMDLIAQTPVPV